MTDQDSMAQGTGAAPEALSAAELHQRIANNETEAKRLEGKLEEFSNYEDNAGNFDSRAYKRDELRLNGINRELSRMYAMQGQVERKSDQWADYAKRKAADFLRGRLPQVPENLREKVQSEFLANFRATMESGILDNPRAQNEQQITEIVRDRYENALGRVYASSISEEKRDRRDGAPTDRGLDQDNEPPPEEEDDPFGGDELAKQLFQQYEDGRNKKHMTLADQMRERRDAALGKKPEGSEA